MAIKVPGKRDRHGRLKVAARSAVATLSLTAMVDMFTVLVVFLLMNYQSTGEVIPMKDNVDLPSASSTNELEPANVVVVGPDGVELNGEKVEEFEDVLASRDWILPNLKLAVEKQIEEDKREEEEKRSSFLSGVQKNVRDTQDPDAPEKFEVRKITIQADKKTDILSLKKVMFTLTEAGGEAINFAVLKIPGETTEE